MALQNGTETILAKIENLQQDHDRLLHIEKDQASQTTRITEMHEHIQELSSDVKTMVGKIIEHNAEWDKQLREINSKFAKVPTWQNFFVIMGITLGTFAFMFNKIWSIGTIVNNLDSEVSVITRHVAEVDDRTINYDRSFETLKVQLENVMEKEDQNRKKINEFVK